MRVACCVALVVASAGSGCACPAPGSKRYQPLKGKETEVFAEARRDVFPNDVAAGITTSETMVAWPGIVRGVSATDTAEGRPILELDVEHRFFDWIEDRSIQPEIFFLSPRGEGRFQTSWQIIAQGTAAWVETTISPKDLVIVYGYPARDEDGAVMMQTTEYIRPYPAKVWRDDVFDYGRDRTDFKRLATPMRDPQPPEEK